MSRRRPVDAEGPRFRSRAEGLIRQARRAGRVVIGVRQTVDAVRERRLTAALLASDLSGPRREALLERLRAAGVPVYEGWTKDGLGELAGRVAVAALGITDRHIADGLVRLAHEATRAGGAGNEEVEESG
ncbi:MAG TPA: ribosomal L7Ae/L30e/S12e/Gadd45 family protein [Gemmatimonadota bacterium]|nr:ribosomal L7Ae/L30e/S12e/Gadd45 family protein [Gemmatimonadota bacterium]